MKITNKHNLPQVLVDAVKPYEPSGRYSASMLTQSPRMVVLKQRHWHEIEQDVSDMIWALYGTALHSVIEKANPENSLQEEYLKHTLPNGSVISGKPDLYHESTISDWKTVSVWSEVFYDRQKEFDYEIQLNTYAYLFRKHGFEVKKLQIVHLMRDWQASKAKFDPQYPQSQVSVHEIDLWPDDLFEKYLTATIDKFEVAKEYEDDELPLCTDQERWVKPSKWALMKNGRKSAIKLYDEKPEIELEAGQYLEERPGEYFKRCEYCAVSQFCNQFRDKLR
jgi:CRISPR/Cas system-associated exonuclease Cas4 (RecB family)